MMFVCFVFNKFNVIALNWFVVLVIVIVLVVMMFFFLLSWNDIWIFDCLFDVVYYILIFIFKKYLYKCKFWNFLKIIFNLLIFKELKMEKNLNCGNVLVLVCFFC